MSLLVELSKSIRSLRIPLPLASVIFFFQSILLQFSYNHFKPVLPFGFCTSIPSTIEKVRDPLIKLSKFENTDFKTLYA